MFFDKSMMSVPSHSGIYHMYYVFLFGQISAALVLYLALKHPCIVTCTMSKHHIAARCNNRSDEHFSLFTSTKNPEQRDQWPREVAKTRSSKQAMLRLKSWDYLPNTKLWRISTSLSLHNPKAACWWKSWTNGNVSWIYPLLRIWWPRDLCSTALILP